VPLIALGARCFLQRHLRRQKNWPVAVIVIDVETDQVVCRSIVSMS
jgi:hypothetical protein